MRGKINQVYYAHSFSREMNVVDFELHFYFTVHYTSLITVAMLQICDSIYDDYNASSEHGVRNTETSF